MTGKNNHGFSLFEMLIVVVIIGIIALAAVPVAELSFIRTKELEMEKSLNNMRLAIKLFKRDCRNAVLQQNNNDQNILMSIPDCRLYPGSLLTLTNPSTDLPGGKFEILDKTNVTVAEFYPKPYLDKIPEDPFVGQTMWLIHYASGTTTSVYTQGINAIPLDHVGIFDVSCVDNTGNRRRGFIQSIDGTYYTDW